MSAILIFTHTCTNTEAQTHIYIYMCIHMYICIGVFTSTAGTRFVHGLLGTQVQQCYFEKFLLAEETLQVSLPLRYSLSTYTSSYMYTYYLRSREREREREMERDGHSSLQQDSCHKEPLPRPVEALKSQETTGAVSWAQACLKPAEARAASAKAGLGLRLSGQNERSGVQFLLISNCSKCFAGIGATFPGLKEQQLKHCRILAWSEGLFVASCILDSLSMRDYYVEFTSLCQPRALGGQHQASLKVRRVKTYSDPSGCKGHFFALLSLMLLEIQCKVAVTCSFANNREFS